MKRGILKTPKCQKLDLFLENSTRKHGKRHKICFSIYNFYMENIFNEKPTFNHLRYAHCDLSDVGVF